MDAYATGNYVTDPDTAFRYARGLPILHPVTREKIRIERPLDFLVVADHAELLQLQVRLDEEDADLMATPTGKRLAELHKQGKRAVFAEVGKTNQGEGKEMLVDLASDRILGDAWQRQVKFADENNVPGKFTALIGWEWSSAPNWSNLHRVVFTSADGATAGRFLPFSSYRSQRPEDLWAFLDKTSRETGAQFVAIPHNSNMSDGRDVRPCRQRGSSDHRRIRTRTHPLGERDGDRADQGNIGDRSGAVAERRIRGVRSAQQTARSARLRRSTTASFARTALLEGLVQEGSIGVNPYKFGVIGSTDSHNSLTSTEEYNFFGKLASQMITAQRPQDRGNFPDLGTVRRRHGRRVGKPEHAAGDLRGVQAQGGVRHFRAAHRASGVRRVRLPGSGCEGG